VSIIHVNQIRAQIEKLFGGKIDLSDADGAKDPAFVESFFLTRALAAYAVYYLAQSSIEDAAAAVTDGGDDNGIDAIHYDSIENRLYVVQSKWIHSGTGEPENGDVKKFISGIKDLCNFSFDRFNKKVQAKQVAVAQALKTLTPNTTLCWCIRASTNWPSHPDVTCRISLRK
jgi:hypothetical protein